MFNQNLFIRLKRALFGLLRGGLLFRTRISFDLPALHEEVVKGRIGHCIEAISLQQIFVDLLSGHEGFLRVQLFCVLAHTLAKLVALFIKIDLPSVKVLVQTLGQR